MDMYGSLSNPSDNFLDFPLNATDSHLHLHLPPPQHHFSNDPNFPSVPVRPSSFQFPQSDEAAELEWLSQFIDDDTTSFHDFPPSHTVLPIGAHTTTTSFLSTSYAEHDHIHNNNNNSNIHINNNNNNNNSDDSKSRSRREANGESPAGEGGVRRCSHCASEKTPQWRTGPLGPKTLCNACGVRFKSGRLVPEYRPAASPTFVLTQHSNSHRKVMELRRQKELIRQQQQQHSKGEEE